MVELIQSAEHGRIPSPPRADIQIGHVLPSDPRNGYQYYEQEREMSVWFEVLKPRLYVTKSSPTPTIINEPGRSPVKVRASDIAKFGTKAERATTLCTYAQRPPASKEQTTETKIAKHSNGLKKHKRGETKICHRHNTSGFFRKL